MTPQPSPILERQRQQTVTDFVRQFGAAPTLVAAAPGRVNLIGEHTDYNDGFVLPCAIDKHTLVAARSRNDRRLRLVAADLAEARSEFSLDAPIAPSTEAPWSNYVRGMVAGLLASADLDRGADLLISSNVPRGAGLSSSAALEMASGLALSALSGRAGIDRVSLARMGQRAEHEYAGCPCGIMDQLISAAGQPGNALLIDCRSLAMRAIPLPAGTAVMIVHSGISRGLVEGEYARRRQQCAAAAAHFGIAALRDLDAATLAARAGELDPLVARRARHVVSENARTEHAAALLAAGDLRGMGRLMAESHASMRDDFEITLPAIDALVELLQSAIGEQGGARMTGGGFGGAVVALLPETHLQAVVDAVQRGYRTPAGASPDIMVESAAGGAQLLD